MYEALECIALRTVKYNDRYSILAAYSRQAGRVALLVPASATASAARIRALTMPLSRFDCMALTGGHREIFNIKDVRPGVADSAMAGRLPSLAMGPVKSAVAMFAAELLSAIVLEQTADQHMWTFLEQMCSALRGANAVETANFHICLLMRLQYFLGIEPDWSTYRPGSVMDLADGVFRMSPPVHSHFLSPEESSAAFRLSRINTRTWRVFAMSRAARNRILDRILEYYRLHLPSMADLQSISVLRSMFDF